MKDTVPVCYLIAGPNGAGKTTFALNYLPKIAQCENFVNADMIASGLSPLSPERERVAAARLFLKELKNYVLCKEDFAFETTLSGKGYLRLIRQLKRDGWNVVLIYLWLPSVTHSIQRVQERVLHGGHDIPEKDIRRRFPRSLQNLLENYPKHCDLTLCLDNSEQPSMIFTRDKNGLVVVDHDKYDKVIQGAGDG